MADIVYGQPRNYPQEGRHNSHEYRNDAIDFREYVVETGGPPPEEEPTRGGVLMKRSGDYVVLKGPLKVAVSTEDITEPGSPTHMTEIVSVPFFKTVRFELSQGDSYPEDASMSLAPVAVPNVAKTVLASGGVSGGAGAIGGHYLVDNPLVGVVTAIIGGGAGYAWEWNRYTYSTKKVK